MSNVPLFACIKIFEENSKNIHDHIELCCRRLLSKCHNNIAESTLTTYAGDGGPIKEVIVPIYRIGQFANSSSFYWCIDDSTKYHWEIDIYSIRNKKNMIFNIGLESRKQIKNFKKKYNTECNLMVDEKLFDLIELGTGISSYAVAARLP